MRQFAPFDVPAGGVSPFFGGQIMNLVAGIFNGKRTVGPVITDDILIVANPLEVC